MARSKITFKDNGKIRSEPQQLDCAFNLEFLGKAYDEKSVLRYLLKIAGLSPHLNETWAQAEELKEIMALERAARSISVTPGNHILETLRKLLLLNGDKLRQAIAVVDPYTRVNLEVAALQFHRNRVGTDGVLPDSWHDISATRCLFDTIYSAHYQALDSDLLEIIRLAINAHHTGSGRHQTKEIDIRFIGKLAEWWLDATGQKPTASDNRINNTMSKFVEFTQKAICAIDNRWLSGDAVSRIARKAIKESLSPRDD